MHIFLNNQLSDEYKEELLIKDGVAGSKQKYRGGYSLSNEIAQIEIATNITLVEANHGK